MRILQGCGSASDQEKSLVARGFFEGAKPSAAPCGVAGFNFNLCESQARLELLLQEPISGCFGLDGFKNFRCLLDIRFLA